jgi:hypothetical protein
MKCLVLCGVVLVGWVAFAQTLQPSADQNRLPDSASTSKGTENASGTPFVVRPVPVRPPALSIQTGPPLETERVASRRFILASLFQIAATIGDVESTQYGLSHGAREANPLFGSHPSRAKQYAIAMPIAGGIVAWSYRLKRSAPHSRHWLIPSIVTGAIHTGAMLHNFNAAKAQ